VADRSVTTPLPPRADRVKWELLSIESTAILREVLIPIHLEGFSTREIATRLEISPTAVKLLTEFFAREVGELSQRP
jgi:DNA-directed RNA polymerase specialized sigma24 family protein